MLEIYRSMLLGEQSASNPDLRGSNPRRPACASLRSSDQYEPEPTGGECSGHDAP